MSILPDLLGTAKGPLREATIHQAPNRDLAIRQGPWKLIFANGGKRELYYLQTKDSTPRTKLKPLLPDQQ